MSARNLFDKMCQMISTTLLGHKIPESTRKTRASVVKQGTNELEFQNFGRAKSKRTSVIDLHAVANQHW